MAWNVEVLAHHLGAKVRELRVTRPGPGQRVETQLRQAQKMEAIGQLAGGVAHDFNNVLTAIAGNAELLQEGFADGDPKRETVEEIRTAASRAESLTRQLLAFSRQQIMQPKVLKLNRVVAGMEIGRAHVLTPVTSRSRMPSSA